MAEVLREEITEIVGFELEDPRLTAVTVTDVVVSENHREAKVFVVIDGSETRIREAMKALQNASAFVKQQVTLNLNLRHTPHLHFVRDTAEENAARIESLLGQITDGENSIERNEKS